MNARFNFREFFFQTTNKNKRFEISEPIAEKYKRCVEGDLRTDGEILPPEISKLRQSWVFIAKIKAIELEEINILRKISESLAEEKEVDTIGNRVKDTVYNEVIRVDVYLRQSWICLKQCEEKLILFKKVFLILLLMRFQQVYMKLMI